MRDSTAYEFALKSTRADVAARALLCVAVLVMAVLWVRPSSRAGAQTSTVEAISQSAYEGTDFRPWLTDAGDSLGPLEATRLDAATEILTIERKAVECERPLELALFVHENDGRAVRNADVLCDWQDQRGSRKLRTTTDAQGVARIRRWIPVSEFGRVTRIRVSVETPDWRAERWVWFIPR